MRLSTTRFFTLGLVASLALVLLLAACEEPPTPTPTPAAAPESGARLLEKLSLIPASLKGEGVWYGDLGRALEMAGVQPPRSRDDLAQSDSLRDAYGNARRGIYLAPAFLGGVYNNPEWEEVFGFNGFEVALAVGFGETSYDPLLPTYLEGDFDENAMGIIYHPTHKRLTRASHFWYNPTQQEVGNGNDRQGAGQALSDGNDPRTGRAGVRRRGRG